MGGSVVLVSLMCVIWATSFQLVEFNQTSTKYMLYKLGKTPTNVATLCQFLIVSPYYRRYVLKLADIAAPIYVFTQKGVPFQWTTAHDEAFSQLQSVLTQTPS